MKEENEFQELNKSNENSSKLEFGDVFSELYGFLEEYNKKKVEKKDDDYDSTGTNNTLNFIESYFKYKYKYIFKDKISEFIKGKKKEKSFDVFMPYPDNFNEVFGINVRIPTEWKDGFDYSMQFTKNDIGQISVSITFPFAKFVIQPNYIDIKDNFIKRIFGIQSYKTVNSIEYHKIPTKYSSSWFLRLSWLPFAIGALLMYIGLNVPSLAFLISATSIVSSSGIVPLLIVIAAGLTAVIAIIGLVRTVKKYFAHKKDMKNVFKDFNRLFEKCKNTRNTICKNYIINSQEKNFLEKHLFDINNNMIEGSNKIRSIEENNIGSNNNLNNNNKLNKIDKNTPYVTDLLLYFTNCNIESKKGLYSIDKTFFKQICEKITYDTHSLNAVGRYVQQNISGKIINHNINYLIIPYKDSKLKTPNSHYLIAVLDDMNQVHIFECNKINSNDKHQISLIPLYRSGFPNTKLNGKSSVIGTEKDRIDLLEKCRSKLLEQKKQNILS